MLSPQWLWLLSKIPGLSSFSFSESGILATFHFSPIAIIFVEKPQNSLQISNPLNTFPFTSWFLKFYQIVKNQLGPSLCRNANQGDISSIKCRLLSKSQGATLEKTINHLLKKAENCWWCQLSGKTSKDLHLSYSFIYLFLQSHISLLLKCVLKFWRD